MKCYILRGPSGSGKTSYYRVTRSNVSYYCSADLFFMYDGLYKFDPSKLASAHSWCFGEFILGMLKKTPEVWVDNTNIHFWEYKNYVALARIFGYDIEIHSFVPNDFDDARICFERNTHGVPLDVILRMCYNFEHNPEEIAHGIG